MRLRHVVDAVDYQLRPGGHLDLLLRVFEARRAEVQAEVNGQSRLGVRRGPVVVVEGEESPPLWRDPDDPAALLAYVRAWEAPVLADIGTLVTEVEVLPLIRDVLLNLNLEVGDHLIRLVNVGDASANSRIVVNFTPSSDRSD